MGCQGLDLCYRSGDMSVIRFSIFSVFLFSFSNDFSLYAAAAADRGVREEVSKTGQSSSEATSRLRRSAPFLCNALIGGLADAALIMKVGIPLATPVMMSGYVGTQLRRVFGSERKVLRFMAGAGGYILGSTLFVAGLVIPLWPQDEGFSSPYLDGVMEARELFVEPAVPTDTSLQDLIQEALQASQESEDTSLADELRNRSNRGNE